jgi:UDP-glucose 4-epimerase
VIQEDARDSAAMGEAVQNQDVLFHCAAHTSHATSMKEPLIDVDVNCRGVITVLEATRRFNPRIKFVHVGTTTQIGRMRYSPIDENHPEFPVDIYSANKTASEKYVLIYGSAYDIPVTVVRLGNTFGPRANIKNPALGFVNYFVGLALQNKPVTVYGTGEQLRNVSYVRTQ